MDAAVGDALELILIQPRTGRLIPPDRLFGIAGRTDLLNRLDRECRINSIRSSKPLEAAFTVRGGPGL